MYRAVTLSPCRALSIAWIIYGHVYVFIILAVTMKNPTVKKGL
jgi:hypothetical protein